jgi:squalene-hopene/tetraprenyl-beta-curcumene cyclase
VVTVGIVATGIVATGIVAPGVVAAVALGLFVGADSVGGNLFEEHAALPADDPVWEKVRVFVSRSQNHSESNDQAWAANDGGFTYMPGYSPHGGTGSYGGMTSAGLLSLLYAGVDKDDPRIQAAHDWISEHDTLDENPGAKDLQGLYYYYNVFAKAMAAYGEPEIVDAAGVSHNWRNDLAKKLVSLQHPEGYWVNEHSPRWWEGDKNLVTAWSVITLDQVLRD